MTFTKRRLACFFLYLSVLCFTCTLSPARAVALLSESLTLYLPWVEYEEQTYFALLNPKKNNEFVFQLDEIDEREDGAPSGGLTAVSEDLEISVPLVSYLGELYSATLAADGNGGFMVTNAIPFFQPVGRGIVHSVEMIETKTADQIATESPFAALAGLIVRFDVTIYRVSYSTLDAFGNLTTASGVIATPVGIQAGAPLLSFQHGTITSRANAPSINPQETGADLALYLMGANGYLTVVPDYQGFGDSSGLHPFMHAKTLAWTVIDLIRATRSLATDNGYPLNGQLFLAGYSEGGYATMAAQREIETYHTDELTITASAPMAGAYDLSGTMLQLVLSGDSLPRPLYFPYVLLSYNVIYGFEQEITNLLATGPVRSAIDLFDGEHDSDTINTALPSMPGELFSSDFLAALTSNDYHVVKAALEENDVYRWTPISPTRLYHCLDDDRVPYTNTIVAHEYFTSTGADVELETLFFGGHSDCAVPALLRGNTWFNSLAELP